MKSGLVPAGTLNIDFKLNNLYFTCHAKWLLVGWVSLAN